MVTTGSTVRISVMHFINIWPEWSKPPTACQNPNMQRCDVSAKKTKKKDTAFEYGGPCAILAGVCLTQNMNTSERKHDGIMPSSPRLSLVLRKWHKHVAKGDWRESPGRQRLTPLSEELLRSL